MSFLYAAEHLSVQIRHETASYANALKYCIGLDKAEIDMYIDYLYMMKQMNVTTFGKYPKNLQIAHDTLSTYKKEIDEMKLIKDFEGCLTSEYTSLVRHEEDEDFCVLIPRKPEDLAEESKGMRNCERSYTERVAHGYCYICFMRK